MTPCILAASHDQAFLQRLSLLLEQAGYRLSLAPSSEQGLHYISSQPVDVFLVDEDWAGGNAFELCKHIKNTKKLAIIPIVLLLSRRQREEGFKVLGVEHIVYKPVDEYLLLSLISSVLSRTRSPVEALELTVKQRRSYLYRRRVLLGGHDRDNTEIMAGLLRQESCEVAVVRQGHEILTRALVFHPHLIIMDVLLPGLGAPADYIKALRLLPDFQRIPVFVFSYYRVEDLGSEDIRQRTEMIDASHEACLLAGASAYFGRFSDRTFIHRLNDFLNWIYHRKE
ncbi:MAG: response regulator [Candidatus Omnitrophota bacterium]|jgi:CheY-like chemotaxis protein